MQGRILGLKLFLEGQEVPIISANVSGGLNRAAMAKITIPPSDWVHKFKPRTLVHLFYIDSSYIPSKKGEAAKSQFGDGRVVNTKTTSTMGRGDGAWETLRVMTYNVHSGVGMDDQYDLERIG